MVHGACACEFMIRTCVCVCVCVCVVCVCVNYLEIPVYSIQVASECKTTMKEW